MKKLVTPEQAQAVLSRRGSLTKRELEVLTLVTQGYMHKEIVDILNISLVMVKLHRKHICQKLGISGTALLTHFALEVGLIGNQFDVHNPGHATATLSCVG